MQLFKIFTSNFMEVKLYFIFVASKNKLKQMLEIFILYQNDEIQYSFLFLVL